MGYDGMKPKLILTDLDGTLLTREKTLSPGNRAALERAARAGAEVVVATGRTYPAIPQPLLELPFLRYFVLINGAKVYDRLEDRVLYRAELPLATAEQIFDEMEGVDATVDCYQDDHGLMEKRFLDNLEHYIHDPHSLRLVRMTRRPCEDLRSAVRAGGESVQKVQFYFPDLAERARVKKLLEKKYPQVILSISLPENLEVNDARATKGAGLLALCRSLGISPAQTVAFGDGTNDISMLQAAGIGVAMDNADPETKAAADLLTGDNQQDGVAQVLDQWFA